jgi:ubiquinone/menaquinone biosynthesis C-methylase UbiE
MVDWSANMLLKAMTRQGKHEEKGELACEDIQYMQADCEALDLEDASFDTVVDTFTLSSCFDRVQ